MSLALMVMMVSYAYTYPQTHSAIYIKHVKLFTYLNFNHTSIKQLKKKKEIPLMVVYEQRMTF